MANPLAKYLKRNGMTPGELARTAGLSRATVWRIANDQRRAGLYMAAALEKATGGAVKVSDWPVHKRAA
jgi:plasmid maintenance system antidote protein VapI